MPSKKPSILCRTTEEIKAKIEIIAEQENRSTSNQVEYILKKYIEEYETQNGNITVKQVNVESNSGNININQ